MTQLATVSHVAAAPQITWTDEEIQLIRQTFAPKATEAEFKLFLYRARVMALDPLKREIYFVKYGSEPGTIIVGIDGARVRAARTGRHVGTKRGVIRSSDGNCIGGWAEVYRSDWREPAREEVSLSEYSTGKANWNTKPETMIKKVAEFAALRIAFPTELGGVYGEEEIEHRERSDEKARDVQNVITTTQETATVTASVLPAKEYAVPMGPWAGKRLSEIPTNALADYVISKREQADREKKKIGGALKEFIDAAERYLTEATQEPAAKA